MIHLRSFVNTFTNSLPGSYWPTLDSWSKRRWKSLASVHGNLMWNHRDEEWFQKHSEDCKAAQKQGQPRPQSEWKKHGTNKHKFDIPFEEYCAKFLESNLSSS
jgi:hypothetical protein